MTTHHLDSDITKKHSCNRICKLNGFTGRTEVAEILGYHPSSLTRKCSNNPKDFLDDLIMAKKIKRNNQLRGI